MRSVSSPGLCRSNHQLRAIVNPKNRTRKAHSAGQATVPAARNRISAKTANMPTICAVSSLRLTVIGCLLQGRVSGIHSSRDHVAVTSSDPFVKEKMEGDTSVYQIRSSYDAIPCRYRAVKHY